MDLPSLTNPCSTTATITSDESLDHRFSVLKKTNQQTRQLNFCLFNPDKDRVDIWLHNLEPHLTQCKTIKMKLPFRFTDNLMISMSHTFYKLHTLHELKVNANGSKHVSDKGLIALNKALSKLHRLEKLKLDFSRCQQITNKGLVNLGQSIYRLQHLTNLSLTFSACEKITNDGLTKLAQRISKLPQLKKLNLILSNCNEVTDEGVIRLSQSLSNLTTLNDMILKFYRCSLTDKSLVSAGENLSKLKPLRRLSLTFSSGIKTNHKGITAEGLQALSKGLSELTNLESLAIKFGWSDTLSDEGLASLNKGLLSLKNLKALQLGFYYCDGITDVGVKSLTNNIYELKKLEAFKINLWTCNSITKASFLNLGFDIAKVPCLKNAQFASETYGWLSFNNKSSLLRFATGLFLQKFGKNILGKKSLMLIFIGLALLLAFWPSVARCLF